MLDLHKEFKPGGQLFLDRWMLSSFTMNDFYLACMVLCLGWSMWKKSHPDHDVNDDSQMKDQHAMLRESFDVCVDLSPTSSEAKRVANVLRAVLDDKADGSLTTPSPFTSSSKSSNPFFPLGKPMSSGMFPLQNEFNLAPLTLQDTASAQNHTGAS